MKLKCPANISPILTIANYFLLNIAEHENFSANKYKIHIYRQRKFHAELS